MSFFPVFLSVTLVVRNQSNRLEEILSEMTKRISALVSDYELIIVDNASDDESVAVLKSLTGETGHPNLQVYALTKEVDNDTAISVGLENALGDFLAVVDPTMDDLDLLPEMLDKSVSGSDVVFANNDYKTVQSLAYRVAYVIFNLLYKWFNGIHLSNEAPQFRVMNRKVINFILQHPQPSLTYRHLPATSGFSRTIINYATKPKAPKSKDLGDSIDRGMRLLVSTTRAPMRIVMSLSIFGAVANLLYSIYVVAVGFFKTNVAPGWISLSLQQSGMFFLISLVLMVLGEYILHMASLSNEGPRFYVGQEFNIARMIRREKLNVEESGQKSLYASPIKRNI